LAPVVAFFHLIINRLLSRLIVADGHALLVVGGGLVVGVSDGVGGHAVGVVGLGPGVDGVDVIEHGEKNGEHYACPAQIELEATLCAELEATMCAGTRRPSLVHRVVHMSGFFQVCTSVLVPLICLRITLLHMRHQIGY